MDKKNQKDEQQWMLLVLLLKEIADSKGITQNQIADQTGLLQSNISRFFSLKYKPTLDTFLQVANAINVNFFFEDKDGQSDLNKSFEKAMIQLGRRPDRLAKN
jgi:DNA-binding phage protein